MALMSRLVAPAVRRRSVQQALPRVHGCRPRGAVSIVADPAARGRNASNVTGTQVFADDTFDVERYLSNRPRYPDHLYSFIRSFHAAGTNRDGVLLDLGCGPGFAAFPLLDSFRGGLVGVDTSKGMIESAPRALSAWLASQEGKAIDFDPARARFAVGSSGDLTSVLPDGSVDLAIAATAAHWFDYAPTWQEMTRVVKPGGTVIWWTYGEHYLPAHPEVQSTIFDFWQGTGGSNGLSLGPYWPQPRRSYLTDLYHPVPFPHELERQDPSAKNISRGWDIASATRRTHPLASPCVVDLSWLGQGPDAQDMADLSKPLRLESVWKWSQYESYIRTSSALHSYMKAHPEEREGKGDIADRAVENIRAKVLAARADSKRAGGARARARAGTGAYGVDDAQLDDDHVRVAWPLGVMAIKRK
ncbi:unnamed protein product [Parajaminaea phylloscopi]